MGISVLENPYSCLLLGLSFCYVLFTICHINNVDNQPDAIITDLLIVPIS